MKKNYETFELKVLLFSSEQDIVTASVSDGVNLRWDADWNTGIWSEE